MAKYAFIEHGKKFGKVALLTGGEIGVLGGSMILSKKFLDFNQLFKNKIAADPTFADKWYIKHQGAIKVGIGLIGATFIKNPWVKLIFIGIALEGFITEVRVLTTDAAGNAFFDKIGKTMERPKIDDELLRKAEEAKRSLSGNPTTMYPTGVGMVNPTTEFPTGVGMLQTGMLQTGRSPFAMFNTIDVMQPYVTATGNRKAA